jgi:hypothetical protein
LILKEATMAAIAPSKENRGLDLRLVDEDFDVTHSGSGNSFTVRFTMEGADLLELQNVLRPRLAAVGVRGVTRVGMTMSLYGVEAGREDEVFAALENAIVEVNTRRERARDERLRSQSATDAAGVVAGERLGKVQDGFRTARAARP